MIVSLASDLGQRGPTRYEAAMSTLGPTRSLAASFATLSLTLALSACDRGADTSESTQADPKVEEADPMVGYDLRRLRPREDETLAAMFDRLHAQAHSEGKRVVVMFSADWCEPCQLLDLELGNTHPRSMIGDVRVLELKEEDWNAVARMNEFNSLRSRWEPVLNTYPLVVLLDAQGRKREEMKEAKERLEQAGLEPTLPIWFEATRLSSS